MMTMVGFIGAGLTPIYVPEFAKHFGMAAGMTSLAGLYFIAVLILLAMRGPTMKAVIANSHEVGA
jgi:hypothetical protein